MSNNNVESQDIITTKKGNTTANHRGNRASCDPPAEFLSARIETRASLPPVLRSTGEVIDAKNTCRNNSFVPLVPDPSLTERDDERASLPHDPLLRSGEVIDAKNT